MGLFVIPDKRMCSTRSRWCFTSKLLLVRLQVIHGIQHLFPK